MVTARMGGAFPLLSFFHSSTMLPKRRSLISSI
jgi:hypothetical protein